MTRRRDYRSDGYRGDGVSIIPPPAGRPLMVRLVRWSAEAEHVLRDSRADHVVIEREWKDDDGSGLSFLAEFADQIRGLGVLADDLGELSVLTQLRELEDLQLAMPADRVDFSRLPSLRKCILAHPAGVGNLAECHELEDLMLARVRVNDLRALTPLRKLRRLILQEMPVLTALDGIDQIPLEILEVTYCARMRSISAVAGVPTLREFILEGGRQIADFDRVRGASSLETLRVVSGPDLTSLEFARALPQLHVFAIGNTPLIAEPCSVAPLAELPELRQLTLSGGRKSLANLADLELLGRIRSLEKLATHRGPKQLTSLAFLRDLRNLRELYIEGTTIGDGDLGVLLQLPSLERVEIRPHKRHYSHTSEQLQAVLDERARTHRREC